MPDCASLPATSQASGRSAAAGRGSLLGMAWIQPRRLGQAGSAQHRHGPEAGPAGDAQQARFQGARGRAGLEPHLVLPRKLSDEGEPAQQGAQLGVHWPQPMGKLPVGLGYLSESAGSGVRRGGRAPEHPPAPRAPRRVRAIDRQPEVSRGLHGVRSSIRLARDMPDKLGGLGCRPDASRADVGNHSLASLCRLERIRIRHPPDTRHPVDHREAVRAHVQSGNAGPSS